MKTNKRKRNYLKHPFRRMTALFLAAAMLLELLPVQGLSLFGGQTVKAAGVTLSNPKRALSNPKTEEGVTTWDCVYFGNYAQSDTTGATKEPIKWRVLSVEGDTAVLLADKNLEIKKYNETYTNVTWETSTLRTWLNSTSDDTSFLNTAFTAEEQAAIRDTEVVNKANPQYGTAGGNTTTDKVYLLSIEESMNTAYGFTGTTSNTDTRKVEDTAYVGSKNSGSGSYGGLWWLRSPGINSSSAAHVGASGGVARGGGGVYNVDPAVRPALQINLQSLSVWDYAGTVDSDGNITSSDTVTTWDCVYFGNYAQSDTTGETKEPIKWRVLSVDEEENTAVLLADKNLEIKKYNETQEDITWGTSTLRTWLNSTENEDSFLNTAFTTEEQAAIQDTEVVNNNNPQYGTAGGDNTTDKVYLLSIEEAMNTAYGFTGTTSNTDTRKVEDTTYLKNKKYGGGSSGLWWLRSPGRLDNYAADVGALGGVDQIGSNVYDAFPAVRPALQINLQSLSAWSYAGTVDSEGNVVEPEPILSNPETVDGVTTWDCVFFGNYVQGGKDGASAEPIKWRVLSVNGNDTFLLADKNLEIKKYNETYREVTWETSTLRSWLNGYSDSYNANGIDYSGTEASFLDNAFTADEQAAIKRTNVVNDNNPSYPTISGGNNTTDKVYLLSIAEAKNTEYGLTSTDSATKTRKVEDTAYVKKQNSGYGSYGLWWLRSPGYDSYSAAYVSASGGVDQNGYSVNFVNPAVRPALHINLQSLSQWTYAGTVDSDGNVVEPGSSITVGGQTGTVTYGTGGSVTYEVEGKNFDDPAFTPVVVWEDSEPEGVTPAFNEGNTQLTMTASATANAGNYPFKVTSGKTESAAATLLIGKADASAITTAVENASMTAYEAREATTKEEVVALADLPSEVEVSLSSGGTATLYIEWATSTTYDAKGEAYAVTGILTGNDNVNVGSVTGQVTVTVTPINAPKPTFADISVFKDESKSAATATDLGSDVLPGSGTVTVDVGGGEAETVDYAIAWNGLETLDMTAADKNETFTGEVSYPGAPSWLTQPTGTMVTRKVTVKEKIPVTVTVTAPDSITYGEKLGNPSADTGDTVEDAAFTYQYNGTLSDGSGTPYSSTEKPTNPGSYTVAAILVSATHMGTSKTESFTISKKDLAWATEGVADSKAYDGTATATATAANQPKLDDVVDGDTVEALVGVLAFASASAGEGIAVTASGYGITGTHAWKYNAPADQPAFGNGTITPKNMTFAVEPIDSLDYTGQALAPPVVVKDGEAVLTLGHDYTVSYLDNTNAGTATVTITGKGNYEGSTGGEEFTINKIAYNGKKTAIKNVLSENAAAGVTITLPDLPEGASYETAAVTTANGLVTGTPSIDGNSLTFDVGSKAANTTDTITIPVTGAMNYTDYEIEVIVTAVAKIPVTVSFHANGGSGSMAPVSVPKGTYTLPSCTYSRSNFSFAGWKVNNTGTTYAAGASITVSGNMTLFAQWTSNGPAFTAVTNITGVPTTATVGTALTLKGNAQPSNATNRTVQWSVKSKGTTGARISGGKLQTSGSGTAVITATIKNGRTSTANYSKDFTIKVTDPVKKGNTYTVSGYRYKVTSITNSKKEASFVGLTAAKKKTATTLDIKNTVKINGTTLNITSVDTKALQGNKKVRTVKLGNNVQSIGAMAFYRCTALRSVTIGTGLKSIGSFAFWNDASLKTITIKSTRLTKIETMAFHNVNATMKVPRASINDYKKVLKGKGGSIKVTK